MEEPVLDPFTMEENEFTSTETKAHNAALKEMATIIKAHNDLMTLIGVDTLIAKISTLVDESTSFSFRSDLAREINPQVPVFIMALQEDVYESLAGLTPQVYESRVISLIQEEIINPTGDILADFMEENGEQVESFTGSYDQSTRDLVMSNIFGVMIGQYLTNNVQLRVII